MTECRPPYEAVSSPLNQHHTDGTVSRDIVLLLPVLQMSNAWRNICLHHVHLPDGSLGVCNAKTDRRCAGCGCPMCQSQESGYSFTLPSGDRAWLCETCASLPIMSVLALREFRYLLNEQGRVDI